MLNAGRVNTPPVEEDEEEEVEVDVEEEDPEREEVVPVVTNGGGATIHLSPL